MTDIDIDKLRADLREGLSNGGILTERFIARLSPDELIALLDHIDRLEESMAVKMWRAANEDLAREKARAEAAEAELARLRAPVGEVGEMVKRLTHAWEFGEYPWFDDVKKAADLITRLAARVEEGERVMREVRARTYSNDRGCELKADAVAEICDLVSNYLQKDQTNGPR